MRCTEEPTMAVCNTVGADRLPAPGHDMWVEKKTFQIPTTPKSRRTHLGSSCLSEPARRRFPPCNAIMQARGVCNDPDILDSLRRLRLA